jgi:small conductance mechanosensitive channel
MEQATRTLESSLINVIEFMPQVVMAILVLVVMYILGRFIGNVFLRFLRKSALSATHRNFFRKIVVVIFVLIGFSIALNILDLQAASIGLLTGGGITALAFGIAFRDIGENILAGIYLAFSKPFRTGDFIATEGLEGVVQEVELRHTHIRTYDGIDIFVPNATLFNQPLLNYTMDGLRRHSFVVGIDYDNDAALACSLLKEKIQGVDKVLGDPPCVASISGFTPQYVELKVYYWIDTFDKEADFWLVKNNIMNICRTTLKDNDFIFSSNVQSSNILTLSDPVKIINTEN